MVAYAFLVVDDDVHSTYREAISNPESVQWKLAMDEEMQSLHKNRTWKLVTLPKEKRQLGANEFMQIRKDFLVKMKFDTRLY